jgi:hypothetical protein
VKFHGFSEPADFKKPLNKLRRVPNYYFELKINILSSQLWNLLRLTLSVSFSWPLGLIFGSRKSLTENLNSFRSTNLPTARMSNQELEQFLVETFPFPWPWALFFGSSKSLTENLNSFRATKIADPVIYFLSARFARPSGDPNLSQAGFIYAVPRRVSVCTQFFPTTAHASPPRDM